MHNVYIVFAFFAERAEASVSTDVSASLAELPGELQELVAMDNKALAQELEDWDKEQVSKMQSSGDPDVTITYEQKPGQYFICCNTFMAYYPRVSSKCFTFTFTTLALLPGYH
jgi:hypothetical protein